jgi:hypothetical protein
VGGQGDEGPSFSLFRTEIVNLRKTKNTNHLQVQKSCLKAPHSRAHESVPFFFLSFLGPRSGRQFPIWLLQVTQIKKMLLSYYNNEEKYLIVHSNICIIIARQYSLNQIRIQLLLLGPSFTTQLDGFAKIARHLLTNSGLLYWLV